MYEKKHDELYLNEIAVEIRSRMLPTANKCDAVENFLNYIEQRFENVKTQVKEIVDFRKFCDNLESEIVAEGEKRKNKNPCKRCKENIDKAIGCVAYTFSTYFATMNFK